MGEQLGDNLFLDEPTFKGERSGLTRWPTDPWSFEKLSFLQMSPNLLNFLTVDAYGSGDFPVKSFLWTDYSKLSNTVVFQWWCGEQSGALVGQSLWSVLATSTRRHTFLSLRMNFSLSSPLVRRSKTTRCSWKTQQKRPKNGRTEMGSSDFHGQVSLLIWIPLNTSGPYWIELCGESPGNQHHADRIVKPFVGSLGRNPTRVNVGTH